MTKREMAGAVFTLAVSNLNALILAAGVAVLYAGLSSAYSRAIANIVLGMLLIVTAVWPYLRARP